MGGGGRKMNAHRHPPGYGINKPCLAQVWVAAWTSKPGRKKINDGVGNFVARKLFKFSVRLLRDPKNKAQGQEKGNDSTKNCSSSWLDILAVGKFVDRKLFKFSVRLLRDPKIRPRGHEKETESVSLKRFQSCELNIFILSSK